MGSGYEGASDGTDETCPFAQVHGICSMEKILFVSEVATGCIKLLSGLSGTVSFLQVHGSICNSFVIRAQSIEKAHISSRCRRQSILCKWQYYNATSTIGRGQLETESAMRELWRSIVRWGKEQFGQNYQGQGRGFTTGRLNEETRFHQSGLVCGTGERF